MKILINAQLIPGRGAGGVETVLAAMVKALGQLDGPEEFILVCRNEGKEWLSPYLGPNSRIVVVPTAKHPTGPRIPGFARRLLKPIKDRMVPPPIEWFFPSVSHGFLESLNGDVIHFPYQDYTICAIPTIFSPHDLQHLHFPQFFSAQTLVWREELYRTACRYSQRVVVGSQWVKEDVICQYAVQRNKIQVIPLAPPTAVFPAPTPDSLQAVRARYCLSRPFLLYPSMTWPHKNHIRMVEAMAGVEGLDLICTGYQNDHWPRIKQEIEMRNLGSRVRFLGLIPGEDLRTLYRLSEFVIIPTLFESTSEPIFEAWEAGKAVACANVTALPEQTAGAAVLFDPFRVSAIREAILELRAHKERFEALGRERLRVFDWGRSARAYRALYRQCAGATLGIDDIELLSNDWMQQPKEIAA